MMYLEKKTRLAAIEWTGSNQNDVEDFVSFLPHLDPHYASFTSPSFSINGTDLTVSWTGGNIESTTFEVGSFVVEGLRNSTQLLVDKLPEDVIVEYFKINP